MRSRLLRNPGLVAWAAAIGLLASAARSAVVSGLSGLTG